jgi:hypothetical protein
MKTLSFPDENRKDEQNAVFQGQKFGGSYRLTISEG